MTKLICPECGHEKVLVETITTVDANTFEHYCYSVKAHDSDAVARCTNCEWTGRRDQLKEVLPAGTFSYDKYRPLKWTDISSPDKPTWGIELKQAGERKYKPVGYQGSINPFKTKKAAQKVCTALERAVVNTTEGSLAFDSVKKELTFKSHSGEIRKIPL
jgi:transcription elongation factor Elf1